MTAECYRYVFGEGVPLEEVEGSLLLAIWSIESLHGECATRLQAAHVLDGERRTLVIDASTAIGLNLNRVFVGFLRREFGADAFAVERITGALHRGAPHPQFQENHA